MNTFIKRFLLDMGVLRDLRDGRFLRRQREAGMFPIFVDYAVNPIPRYGYGKQQHSKLSDILNRNRSQYKTTLRCFLDFKSDFQTIPVRKPDDPRIPFWLNGFFQGLDPLSLYAFACLNNPQIYLEIGSGNSTKFMRKAIKDHGLCTRIVSVDPKPRAEIDALCDENRRELLENVDLTLFTELRAGDILFFDGSHRVFTNSDVSVFFLDVLPALPPGVLVYVDDIYLPLDYPPEWSVRYYSEQYMLGVLLLADSERYEIVLPCAFVGQDPELSKILDPIWLDSALLGAAQPANGFWLRTAGSNRSS